MEGLTPDVGPPMRHCSKGNHDLADTPENFCGTYRWCRWCFSAYRKEWRKKARAKILALRASDAPLCGVCDSKPIARPGARRCVTCISGHRYRCQCSRISSNPSCGKCRGVKLRAAKAAKREAALAQRLNVVTGNGTCALCNFQLSRDESGNIIYGHTCG